MPWHAKPGHEGRTDRDLAALEPRRWERLRLRTGPVRAPGGVGRPGRSVCKGISMDDEPAIPSPALAADPVVEIDAAQVDAPEVGPAAAMRDIAEVPAIELISTAALHLMSAAAVKCGLGHDEPGDDASGAVSHVDLDEARKLISALAGLVTAAAPEVGNQHARLLRDGLRQVQLAFREASVVPDPPGQGPGERLTGPVS